MDLETLIEFCREWEMMGSEVREHFATIVKGRPLADHDLDAMKRIRPFLRMAHRNGVEDALQLLEKVEAAIVGKGGAR
jgi:hypothetical protein